jgi:hypothetical protein
LRGHGGFARAVISTARYGTAQRWGTGPRSCVGRQFAIHETTILLGALISRFRLRLADPGAELSMSETRHAATGTVHDRRDAAAVTGRARFDLASVRPCAMLASKRQRCSSSRTTWWNVALLIVHPTREQRT